VSQKWILCYLDINLFLLYWDFCDGSLGGKHVIFSGDCVVEDVVGSQFNEYLLV